MVDEPIPEATAAYEGLGRVLARAEETTARATRLCHELLETAPDAASPLVATLLATLGQCPRGLLRRSPRRAGARPPSPSTTTAWPSCGSAPHDAPKTPTQRLAVLRRLATRASLAAVRARAAVACAELLDRPEGDPRAAAEMLTTLLDEQPEEPHAAATLAALGEHLVDDALAEDALRAVARAATRPPGSATSSRASPPGRPRRGGCSRCFVTA
jgi:hypothetical protein